MLSFLLPFIVVGLTNPPDQITPKTNEVQKRHRQDQNSHHQRNKSRTADPEPGDAPPVLMPYADDTPRPEPLPGPQPWQRPEPPQPPWPQPQIERPWRTAPAPAVNGYWHMTPYGWRWVTTPPIPQYGHPFPYYWPY